MSTLFEIRRRSFSDPVSRVFTGIYPRGKALGGQDKDTAQLAQSTNFMGFVTRDVTVDGPTLSEIMIPTNPLGLPFKSGEVVAIESADEYEAEGVDYLLTSGTGLLDASTTAGTKISFKDGRAYVAQSGDHVYYTVEANLSGTDRVVNAGAVRMLFTKASA